MSWEYHAADGFHNGSPGKVFRTAPAVDGQGERASYARVVKRLHPMVGSDEENAIPVARLERDLAPQGAVEIIHRRELQQAADPIARREELVEEYTERTANPYIAAERGYVDDVIDPAETRPKLIAGLRLLRSKREELPKRKHGNVPL